jgi:uncharacterized protein (TIGR00369 family)
MKIIPANPEFKKYVELKISRNKYQRLLGFDIHTIEPGRVKGILTFSEIHEQQNGFLHGAVTSALCDMACGFAAYTLVAEGEQIFTAEIKVSYLRPGTAKEIHAEGWVLKPGKNMHFCEAEIFEMENGEKKLIAKASSIMALVRDKGFKDKYIEV